MSCQFKPIAKVDVKKVKSLLNPEEISDGDGERYNDSSGSYKTQDNETELQFLNDYLVSLSPGGEFMVLAHNKTLCILSAKWDSHEEEDVKTKYKITWNGNPCHNASEQITAVMCLPLLMASKTSRSAHTSEQCSLDWTCIAVGFSSGILRFYDEGGGLLLSEQIHDEPITNLKCQCFHPSKTSSYDDYPEELYVTFCSTVAVIPGFALFQTLRACRNQLARVIANFAESFTPPPLAFKKWAFVDQDKMKDCEIIGPSSSDLFDHLMTASICGGFNTCYRSGAPKSTLVVAAGKGPFVGFHHALEGVEGRSVLTDVAQAVKSKFKGFFRSSGHDRQKSVASIETPDSLACRFGICDFSREADHIGRSPNREYSAVTDALGRVTLINNLRGIAVKMWKGYRKAQCGWLQVEEEESAVKGNPKHLLRTVLFLVLYDPKKGVLEVWTVPNGIRVAAFSCSKRGRLLYTSHGLVGLNNIAVKWANKSSYPCIFLDPKGMVFQVVVPFHCALSDASSERAGDLALLRKLKAILREGDLEEEQLAAEVGLIAAELKTTEVRKQMLNMLTSIKHVTVDALEAALAVFMDRATSEDLTSLDSATHALLLSSQQLRNVLALYKFVHQQQQRPPNYSTVVPQKGVTDLQTVCDVLSVSEREVTALKSLVSLVDKPVNSNSTPKKEMRVTFNESASSGSSLVEYLYCFDFGKKSFGTVAPNAVAVKKLSPAKSNSLAGLLFQGILYSDIPVEVWQAEAACSGILPLNLLQLAIQFWLNRNISKALEVEMIRYAEVIKAICFLEEVNTCDLSSFWSSVRSMLMESYQPFNALTAALLCRAVALSLEKSGLKKHSKSPKKKKAESTGENRKDLETSIDTDNAHVSRDSKSSEHGESSPKEVSRKSSSEWENVSWEKIKWNLLIGRLEDVALLDLILGQNIAALRDGSEKTVLPCLQYEKPNISFSSLLKKGKGAVSENVAKWLITCGIDPKLLIHYSDIEWTERVSRSFNWEVDEPGPEDKSEINIREGIPLTTEEGTEASSLCAAHAQILDNIFILKEHFPYSLSGSVLVANISWEFLLEWHKSPECIDILNAAIVCLQTVPNIHIQQGLSCLMWTSHLRQRFESATQIVKESHGNPKDKLCHRELQMSEAQLSEFVEVCIKFIELYIEASSMSEVMHPPGPDSVVNRCEYLWEYEESLPVASTPSLTNLALLQPQASFDHLHLLHQLAETIHIILCLGLRKQSLTALFKPEEWSVLFSDDTKAAHKILHFANEPQLAKSRLKFLMHAVSAAMENVLSSDPSDIADMSSVLCPEMSTAMKWIGKCQKLAYTWQVSMDPLRRHQVCLFYSSGHDRLAEEILPAVNDLETLASNLLLICGQRLRLIMDRSNHIMDQMSNLDPSLTSYLFELNTQGVRQVSLSDTALLVTHVIHHLPEDHPEHYLAVDLFEALQALESAE